MAPRRKPTPKPGNFRTRQTAKLNSARAQKSPITPQPRVGPRRQLPPSTQGGTRVGNSSQPYGPKAGNGQAVRQVKVRVEGPKQLPPAKTVPPSRQLPGMQGPQPMSRPAQPGTSRPAQPTRQQAAATKLANAAKGTSSTNVRTGMPAKGLLNSGLAKKAGFLGMAAATADQARRVFNPKDNIVTSLRDLGNTLSNSGRPGPGHSRYQAPKPTEKQGPPAPRPEQIAKYRADRDARHMGQRAALQRDFPTTRNSGSNSSGGSNNSGGSGSSGGGGSRQSSSSSGSAPKPRFSGSVAEGRRIWAEKYSSDKYKGQAIHKEATKALEQMKNNESGQRAKNIGPSGASPATNFETKTKIDSSKVPDFKKIKGRQFGK